jgi:hypothetical protein
MGLIACCFHGLLSYMKKIVNDLNVNMTDVALCTRCFVTNNKILVES